MNTFRNKGFTLVELLIVIIILVLLAAIATIGYEAVRAEAAEAEIMSDASNVSEKVELAFVNDKKFPTDLADLGQLRKSPTTIVSYESNGTSYCLAASSSKPGSRSFTVRDDAALRVGSCGDWVPTYPPDATSPTPPAVIPAPSTPSVTFVKSTVKVGTGTYRRYNVTATGGTCAVGATEWKILVTGGSSAVWTNVSWQTSNTKVSDIPENGIYSPDDVTVYAKPRCVSGSSSAEGSTATTYSGNGGGGGPGM